MIRTLGVRVQREDDVEEFLVSVIDTVSNSSYPTSPTPTDTCIVVSEAGRRRLQNMSSVRSLEVVDEFLGSLKSTSAIVERSEHVTPEKKELPRRDPLKRKTSLAKPLSPEDLGCIHQPETVAEGNSCASTEPTLEITTPEEHLSSYHLRKPISHSHSVVISSPVEIEVIPHNPVSPEEKNDKEEEKEGSAISHSPSTSQAHSLLQEEEEDNNDAKEEETILKSSNGDKSHEVHSSINPDNSDQHGPLCVHHYHHHSHYHLHDPHYVRGQSENHFLDAYQLYHPLNFDSGEETPQYDENSQAESPMEHVKHDEYSLPSPHDLQDISFYRKFSATSPFRSKSSMAWPSEDLLTTKCSKPKKQKSRSTPMKLDVLAIYPVGGYRCWCGGCCYCCNPVLCRCCCDECCCARQGSQLSPDDTFHFQSSNDTSHSEELKSSKRHMRGRSHSLESVVQPSKDGNEQEDIKVDKHPLQQLNNEDISDSDDDDDEYDDNHDTLVVNKETTEIPDKEDTSLDDNTKLERDVDHVQKLSLTQSQTSSRRHQSSTMNVSDTVQPRTTNVVFIQKKTVSSHRHRQSSNRRREVVRVATGGIHSTPNAQRSPSGHHGILHGENQGLTSTATMTLTVDTMSLFLDAVHLQVTQEE